VIYKYLEKIDSTIIKSFGPIVCFRCEISYTKDKYGWYCPLCNSKVSTVFWKDLNQDKKDKVNNNDKFYSFMQLKRRQQK